MGILNSAKGGCVSVLDDYLERIDAVRPGLAKTSVVQNQEGMVNNIVVVDDEFTFRFPKTEWAQQTLIREAKLIDLARPHVAVQLPELQLHDDSMASYRWLPGVPLTREFLMALDVDRRTSLLQQLGAFLRDLHGIPATDLVDAEASEAVRSRESWMAFFDEVREILFPLLFAHQRASVDAMITPVIDGRLDLDAAKVLIHGDIAPYHLLVDPEANTLSGVIDFGVAGLGDPAIDIALLLYNYGESMTREVGVVYPLTPELLDRSRFWASTLELQWALAGLRDDDKSLLVAHIGSVRGYSAGA
jgi:aminoglycoside 2''-phosphotransferase